LLKCNRVLIKCCCGLVNASVVSAVVAVVACCYYYYYYFVVVVGIAIDCQPSANNVVCRTRRRSATAFVVRCCICCRFHRCRCCRRTAAYRHLFHAQKTKTKTELNRSDPNELWAICIYICTFGYQMHICLYIFDFDYI